MDHKPEDSAEEKELDWELHLKLLRSATAAQTWDRMNKYSSSLYFVSKPGKNGFNVISNYKVALWSQLLVFRFIDVSFRLLILLYTCVNHLLFPCSSVSVSTRILALLLRRLAG